MKLKVLFIALFFGGLQVMAQNTLARPWHMARTVSLNDPYFGIATNAQGETLLAGGGNATNYNFTITKRDTAGLLIYSKVYSSRNQGKGKAKLDANEDLLVQSSFASIFELTTDTFTTASVTDRHMFIGKFDGQTGTDIWVKTYPQETPKNIQFLDNGNILLELSATSGDFYFDGNLIANLPYNGYMFLELSNTDGSVVRHWHFQQYVFPDETSISLNADTLSYITSASGGSFNQTRFLLKKKYDVANAVEIQSDSLFYKSQYNNFLQGLDEQAMWFDHNTGDFYLATGNSRELMVLGNDTFNTNEYALMHYDDHLNVKNRVDSKYEVIKIYARDTTLVTAFEVGVGKPLVYFGTDTVEAYNYEESYLFAVSNLSLQHRSYAFMATDKWDTGLELRDIDIDANNNVSVLGFHEDDIIFAPFTSNAANRSWKHHSAYGRLQFGAYSGTTGIAQSQIEEAVRVYPNPFLNRITIEESGDFNYALYNLNGQLVLKGSAAEMVQLQTETLINGMYLLNVESEERTSTVKLIKN